MNDPANHQKYYAALLVKDSSFDGVFFAGIRTTGIFCRPTCSARKPKAENCEFFKTAEQALLAGYRPCKRCTPLLLPNEPTGAVKQLIDAVENEPEKRWRDSDFNNLGLGSSTARRQFKLRFGLTFVAYARARRMGLALGAIKKGARIIDAQLDAGYQSGSGFRDAFTKTLGATPRAKTTVLLYAAWLDTPLGPMLAIADETALHLLEFTDRRGLEREIERLRIKRKAAIIPGETPITAIIKKELTEYFAGKLNSFKTPLALNGTPFQQSVWQVLLTIPYGTTRTYAAQANILNKPTAVRAVASANGCNQLAIIIPCHRVIGSDGKLTGYAGGLARKQWLLEHEGVVLL